MSQENNTTKTRSYLSAILSNKCPRCRRGDLFVTNNPYAFDKNRFMHMNDSCAICGQPTDIEVGFYYGTGYVSYGLTVAFSVATFIAWKVLIGMSFAIDDNRVFYWFFTNLILLLLLQPLFMRFSRTLWLSWFVKYNPNWEKEKSKRNERIVDAYKHGW